MRTALSPILGRGEEVGLSECRQRKKQEDGGKGGRGLSQFAWGTGQEEGDLKALPPRKKTLSLDLFLGFSDAWGCKSVITAFGMLISSPAFGRILLHSETSAPLLSHFRVDFGNEGLFSLGFRNYF